MSVGVFLSAVKPGFLCLVALLTVPIFGFDLARHNHSISKRFADQARQEIFKRQYAQALELFATAADYDPSNITVYFDKAWCFEEVHNYAQASVELSKGLLVDPENLDMLSERARDYGELGRNELDLADISLCLRLSGGDGRYHLQRAYFYKKMGRFEEALADFNDAQALHYPDVAPGKGDLFMEMGAYRKAVVEYSMAIQRYSDLESQCESFSKTSGIVIGSQYDKRAQAYDAVGEEQLAAKDRSRADFVRAKGAENNRRFYANLKSGR
jgi:tetratricopeptide (TPR) repeat protein